VYVNMNILGRTIQKRLISIIIILSTILLFLWFIKKNGNDYDEGCTQELPFILKEGDDIFDDFYAQIYDIIHKPNLYVDSITDDIIKNTNINEDKCVSLVIAGDTGEQCNSFQFKGIETHTIFKHSDMYNHSLIKYLIIIYGKNCCDETIDNKYFQLINLGYIEEKLFIYYGGLLEWCLLQDVYDDTNFPTTNKCVDILRFRGNQVMYN
jgi:hypothetical protein